MSLGDERESSGGYGGTGQTRTRLPDTDPDPYGTQRRGPRSSSRGLVTVVGVVVLLIAAIAFANRGGGDASDTDGSTNKPDAAATAPTGKRPVGSKAAGIPTGYAHDQQGAESAAANYAVALGSAAMFNKVKRDAVLETIYTTSRIPEYRAKLDEAYSPQLNKRFGLTEDGSAPTGFTFVSRTNPIGTKVTEYSADTATVEVWCSGLLGLAGEGSTTPVTNSWFTTTMKLQWAGGDWKIVTDSQKNGPAPVPGDDRASSADDMAKAVEEYGGFTYAR
ncbi:hypothetical protein [Streptomyces sp. NPDC004830]